MYIKYDSIGALVFVCLYIAPGDYEPTTELLTFSATNTEYDVSISIEDDNVNEALEQFFAGLTFESTGSDGSIQLSPDTAVVLIGDDDGKCLL